MAAALHGLFTCAALAALVQRCRPPRRADAKSSERFAHFLAENRVSADIVTLNGPDHTTREAAATLGLPDDSAVIKSLVFVVDDSAVMVLARGCDHVSLELLSRHCCSKQIRFATAEEAEAATGFRPGSIPPLWPAMSATTRIVMDRRVRDAAVGTVYAGTGMAGDHLRIAPAELWRVANALGQASCGRVVDDQERQSKAPTLAPAKEATPEHAISPHVRARKVGTETWEKLKRDALSEDEAVEVMVLRVRRQGKLLVFASVQERSVPPMDSTGRGTRPRLGQLIAGGLLVSEVGQARAAELIRQVRPGAIVVARGRVQRNPREADAPAHALSTADIVARSLDVPANTEMASYSVLDTPAAEPRRLGTGALAALSEVAMVDQQGSKPSELSWRKHVHQAFTCSPKGSAKNLQSSASLALPPLVLVDDLAGVHRVSDAIDRLIVANDGSSGEPASGMGMDLEWRPRRLAAAADGLVRLPTVPVAVLQLATSSEAFVIDMLALARDDGEPSSTGITADVGSGKTNSLAARVLRDAVGRLMRSAAVPKLGYALRGDLDRLEAALPGSTDGAVGLVDVQQLASNVLSAGRRSPPGLRHACAEMLGVDLDKAQQVSDWEQRPMTDEQLVYAATDASILLPLRAAIDSLIGPVPQHVPPPKLPSSERIVSDDSDAACYQPPPPKQPATTAPSEAVERRRVFTQDLQLPVDSLLGTALGRLVGMRGEVVQLCAALGADGDNGGPDLVASRVVTLEPKWERDDEQAVGSERPLAPELGGSDGDATSDVVHVIQCGDGGAITQWMNGACLYVNAGRYRNGPSARHRNRFWREAGTSDVRVSWYPSRGHTVVSPTVTRLLESGMTRLLFCRRAPSQPYRLCGRLQSVAIAVQQDASEDGAHSRSVTLQDGSILPVWAMAPEEGEVCPVPHVVFRLLDAAELLPPREDILGSVLGGRQVEPSRPTYYRP